MAANKFATMLHGNTHKITVILVYAVLEWVLIFLLLLNSLFSFLISKFANYFGLKPPCLHCSRLDHIIDPNKKKDSYRDLLCESHATEISKLGYCPNHQKLAEKEKLCRNCISTQPKYTENSIEVSRRIGFFTWVSEKRVGNCEKEMKCSCCDESLSSKFYPSFLLFKPSWGTMGYSLKGGLKTEAIEEESNEGEISDTSNSDCFLDQCGNDHEIKDDDDDDEEPIIQVCCREDESVNMMNLPQNISSYGDIDRLLPIALIDSSTIESQIVYVSREEDSMRNHEHFDGSLDSEPQIGEQVKLVKEADSNVVSEVAEKTMYGIIKEAGKLQEEEEEEEEEEKDDDDDDDEDRRLAGDQETNSKIFTGMDKKSFKPFSGPELFEISNIDQGSKPIMKDTSQKTTILPSRDCKGVNHHSSTISEESCDVSVISEIEGGDGILTVEELKSALRAERKALSSLYAELEEERSAAAIAASQTMAMITRLQEEKAAMQMEAVQYQRMMEEQSEYDQEALQLLNELMVKREKEKQELEREVEVYRKRVFDYEAKEKTKKMMMMMRGRDGIEDTDHELSIDLNHESNDSNNTLTDGVVNFEEMGVDQVKHLSTLDDSLAEFDEERLSILYELKALEEKLFTLADDEEEHLLEDVKPTGYFENYGNDDDNYGFSKENGDSNGEEMDSVAKNLLPLFDETGIADEEGEWNGERIEQNSMDSKSEVVNKKLAIEEEVDHVYERLQALETDRDFLKHCISSLKKGDKGMDLLQEILQHLRDLRTVEIRARNACDSPLS